MTAHLVYVTAADQAEAVRIAEAVVGDRLAACANILPPITAVFRWQGAVRHGSETAFLLKTSAERLPALIDRVTALHSYDCPCVVAWPLADGHPAFLDWIAQETA